jgi:hypothetical protein
VIPRSGASASLRAARPSWGALRAAASDWAPRGQQGLIIIIIMALAVLFRQFRRFGQKII